MSESLGALPGSGLQRQGIQTSFLAFIYLEPGAPVSDESHSPKAEVSLAGRAMTRSKGEF
jgi:hypothetical protein